MINNFDEIINYSKRIGPKVAAVACAEDISVLKTVEEARLEGMINAILIGDKSKIISLLSENSINYEKYIIIDEKNKEESCNRAVQLAKIGNASIIMKGFVDTSIILKAILNKYSGLKMAGSISHVGVLKVRKFDRFFIVSDSAVNISPSVGDKVSIINNAVIVAQALNIEKPRVAIVCPVEKVNTKIQSTVDAEELVKLYEQGHIKGCVVGGPLALDNAISEEAAICKGINNPVAGNADILIAHNLEVGNVLNKSIEYFGDAEKAGILVGAKVPVMLTSRASSNKTKLNSIALAVLTECKC